MKKYLCISVFYLVLSCTWADCQDGMSIGREVDEINRAESWPGPQVYSISDNLDDGTEVNDIWYPDGYDISLDSLRKDLGGSSFTTGVRFTVPELEQGQTVKYARLLVCAQRGKGISQVNLKIRGVAEDSPATFSQTHRPSQLPKTTRAVDWDIHTVRPSTRGQFHSYIGSPNLANIINEILAQPDWGGDLERKTLILTIEDNGSVGIESGSSISGGNFDTSYGNPPILEIYTNLAACFIGKPMLGRPTDTSVTINVISLLNIDIYVEFGTESARVGYYPYSTAALLNKPAEESIEIVLDNLEPDMTYYYRICYKTHGDRVYLAGQQGRFHTQRRKDSSFVFAVQADSHIHSYSGNSDEKLALYELTLNNISLDRPDFLIDLGDLVVLDRSGDSLSTFSEVIECYLNQRRYLDKIAYSLPFYLVLGNHESEQGWRALDDNDLLGEWATLARKEVIPNPFPNDFYLGNQDDTACCGLREDYYAWEWGDALFVVLDPFWYTTAAPCGKVPCSGWDWTLGEEQYNWLHATLHNSGAKWKFVFCHHVTGGTKGVAGRYYGRGGIEVAKYKVVGFPSFEWGGEDENGDNVFDTKRPGWRHGAIHDMMVKEGVTIFFHGHDHVYVHQELDGIVYQECPRPNDDRYGRGFSVLAYYVHGVKQNNSGYLRMTVSHDSVRVEYVRSILPEDEPIVENGNSFYNQDVSYAYTIHERDKPPRKPKIAPR